MTYFFLNIGAHSSDNDRCRSEALVNPSPLSFCRCYGYKTTQNHPLSRVNVFNVQNVCVQRKIPQLILTKSIYRNDDIDDFAMSLQKGPEAPQLILPNENTYLDWAVEEARKATEETSFLQSAGRSLLVVGASGAGKTTFIIKTFELDEEVTPTFGVDYFFALSSELDAKNELCNIWELAGGTMYRKTLYEIDNVPNLSAVMILDLSKPTTLTHSFKTFSDVILSYVGKTRNVEELSRTMRVEIKDHPDADVLSPFPIPLVIVCTKFDKFQSFEPEQRRVVTKYLRFLAHLNYATIFFFSSRAPTLVRTSKEIMRHFSHGFELQAKTQVDYNKPLLVVAGSDSFASIDEGLENFCTMESYENLLNNHFKQEPPKEKKLDITPLLATANEKRIDDLLQMTEEELAALTVEDDLKHHLFRNQHLSSEDGSFLFDPNF